MKSHRPVTQKESHCMLLLLLCIFFSIWNSIFILMFWMILSSSGYKTFLEDIL